MSQNGHGGTAGTDLAVRGDVIDAELVEDDDEDGPGTSLAPPAAAVGVRAASSLFVYRYGITDPLLMEQIRRRCAYTELWFWQRWMTKTPYGWGRKWSKGAPRWER